MRNISNMHTWNWFEAIDDGIKRYKSYWFKKIKGGEVEINEINKHNKIFWITNSLQEY